MRLFLQVLSYSALVLIGFCLFTSCKTQRLISNNSIDVSQDSLIKVIQKGDFSFELFSSKAKVRISSPELKGGGKMNIRMKKDSVIWFNFKKVSIEGARGLITPEEYMIIYRTEKQYEKGSLTDLANHFGLPLDFNQWQDYLGGRIPQPNKSTIKIEKESDSLTFTFQDYTISYHFSENLELVKYVIRDTQNRTLAVAISDYDEGLNVYKKRKFEYFIHQKLEVTLEMELSDIEINVPKKMPFSIPDHYTQL